MSELTSKKRKKLPKKAFAEPSKRKYPIDTSNRARNALARVSANGTPAKKAKVRKAVAKKFPKIQQKGK